MSMLPTFRGYTVDFRLRQFRKAVYGQSLEFIDFHSRKGQNLMTEFLKTPEGAYEAKLYNG